MAEVVNIKPPSEANQRPGGTLFEQTSRQDLKRKSVRGGLAAVGSHGAKFILRTGTMMVMARLLTPADFGLQGMVLAVTGVLGLFRDVGLSMATIQRDTITHEQTSTLFWINLAVGLLLALAAMAFGPILAVFYHEPKLVSISVVSGIAFLFNGLAAQHQALLQRSMRFVTIAKIDLIALFISSVCGIFLAALGCGYWSLIAIAVIAPIISAIGVWIAMPWIPTRPRRDCDISSMLRFGGVITCNTLVVYLAYNMEKILLGRFWGADALGLYGRAYQLVNLPAEQLNNSLGSVAFPALSRIQGDVSRLCRSFLKGYAVLFSMTFPATLLCSIYAEELVYVVLGPKWLSTGPTVRLLTPTIVAFALINPFGWFLQATGRTGRSLAMAIVIAPVVITGIALGLSRGPNGVAIGYSGAMVALIVPLIIWAVHNTGITLKDYWAAIVAPLTAGVLAGIVGLGVKVFVLAGIGPLWRVVLGSSVMALVYAGILFKVFDQSRLYLELIEQIKPSRKS
jgi:O-antigen/teichoic acid export membrane protein